MVQFGGTKYKNIMFLHVKLQNLSGTIERLQGTFCCKLQLLHLLQIR